MNKIAITFSGPAGSGINTVGGIVGEIFSELGFYIIGDKEYSSLIKGGNNIFTLYISSSGYFLSRRINVFLSLDQFGIERNQKVYDLGKTIDLKGKGNMYLLGFAGKTLGLEFSVLETIIQKKYSFLVGQLEEVRLGYDECTEISFQPESPEVRGQDTPKAFLFGNEIVSNGAVASDLGFFGAYPMTPASSFIDVLCGNEKVIFFQGEDEIAVAMATLGAKFAGKRALCATSGGGFALMTESIGFSNQAEIGGVYVLSQRTGPSTGTPTFTEQSDVLFAVNASFGDTKPIVLTPSTFEEGYNFIGKALNWSDIYGHPVIFLLDKQFSESYISVDEKILKAEPVQRGKLLENPPETFARYELTEDGISPYTIPGTLNGEFIATSYDHDEYGTTSEDSQVKGLSTEKRFRKLETFINVEYKGDFHGYEIINHEANNFFVCMGFNRYMIEGYLRNHPDWGCIVIKMIQPLDPRLADFFEERFDSIGELVFVENNFTGQLQSIITEEFLGDIWEEKITNVRKYTLYPIFEEELGEQV